MLSVCSSHVLLYCYSIKIFVAFGGGSHWEQCNCVIMILCYLLLGFLYWHILYTPVSKLEHYRHIK